MAHEHASCPPAFPWPALQERIARHEATVAVVGLGYVGLPLAVAFARAGFRVIGFDVSEAKVQELLAGHSYILDVPTDEVAALVAQGTLTATHHPERLAEADAVIICVPTPCQRGREPDLSYIESAAHMIARVLQPGRLIVLESTTYPGTTDELLVPILQTSGLRLYDDFQVAFSPERVDPGNPTYHVENTPKVVGGMGETAGELTCRLYGEIIERIVRVDGPREAEMEKLIENTFRHINIALANELAIIARKMGINIWQAMDAAATKPYGFMAFYPGPGVGGHCIPIDPHYLSWKAREMGAETSFIELAERINHNMPEYVVRLVIDSVNEAGKTIRGAKVLVIGLAYKRDIDDLRESPALTILDLLYRRGADVAYHDPFVPTYRYGGETLQSVALTPETVAAADCVLIVTDHTRLDREMLVEHAPLIVDTRNCLKAYRSARIVRL